MTLYLKGCQKYDKSKLRVLLLLSKLRHFEFDLSYFLYPFRYKVIQYLIGKPLDMVKMSQEGSMVTALLASVRSFCKVTIYYINWALLIFNR